MNGRRTLKVHRPILLPLAKTGEGATGLGSRQVRPAGLTAA